MTNDNNSYTTKDNLFNMIAAKFIPFWPLFVGLFIIGMIGGTLYIKLKAPVYQSFAALIVNDEEKGVGNAQLIESISVFESKKIVENEIEILLSQIVIDDVVSQLALYAELRQDGLFVDNVLFKKTPIKIILKDPANPLTYKNAEEVKFKYSSKAQHINIENSFYDLNTWVANPHGGSEMMFIQNENADESDSKLDNLYYKLINPNVAADRVLRNLYVGAANKSSTVVKLNYKDTNPERGNAVLNQLINSYRKEEILNQNNLATNTLKFVEDRIEQVGKQLDSVELELQKYRTKEGVINLSEQGNLYLQNVGNYDRRIADIDIQLSVLRKVESYVVSKKTNTGIVPSTLGIEDPILPRLLQQLYDAEIEYEELSKTTAKNNPILVTVRNRIEQIRPSILENVRNQKSSLRASRGSLTKNSGKYNQALNILPEQERKYVEITRKKKNISELLDYLSQKREETALSYSPTVGDIRVIQNAKSTTVPIAPRKMFVFALASFLALGAGIAWVGGKELLNSKILFRTELESRTNLPVLGELAYIEDNTQNKRLITKHQNIYLTDQFRQLLSSMGVYDLNNPSQTILVTSNIPGEGKSYISSNLALSIALTGKKTALVDLDLRKPGVSSVFGLSKNKGLSEFLGTELAIDKINNKDKSGLTIFPSGKKALNSSELLTKPKLAEFFKYLKEEFECIIIDSPPMQNVSDPSLIAGFADQTLITIRHNHTPKFIVNKIDENVNRKRLQPAFLVFNGVKARGFTSQNYGYGYGYEASMDDEKSLMATTIPEFFNKLKASFSKKA